MNKAHSNSDRKMAHLPGWLWPNANSPLYKKIWEAVQEDPSKAGQANSENLVDTNKVFALLLTSKLSTDDLGYIWSLANQKYSGKLTEQELYIVLALVALAQASIPFNSLEVLNYIRIPPTPILDLTVLDTYTNSMVKTDLKKYVPPMEISSSININKKQGNSTKTANIRNVNSLVSDEFGLQNHNYNINISSHSNPNATDLKQPTYNHTSVKQQSLPHSSDANDDFSDFQSAPISSISNIPNLWDSKQGSAIGSRLANHNLGVKKSLDKVKKTNLSKISNNYQVSSAQLLTNNLSLHNKELQTNEPFPELFPKCTIKNQGKTVILKDTAIRSSQPLEATNKLSVRESISDKIAINKCNTLPKANLTETVSGVPLQNQKPDLVHQDLMSLQPTTVDKYSALRALVEEPILSSKIDVNKELFDTSIPADDFGDFVSAEQPKPKLLNENLIATDLLRDFDFIPTTTNTAGKSDLSLTQEISDAFNALIFEDSSNKQIEEKFNASIDTEKNIQKEDATSVNSIDLAPSSGRLTRSGSVPSLDLKSFLPSSQEDEQQIENMHQMIYLDWKQYMESCVLLLQVAANTFTGITSSIVLKEVLSSAQGYNFLINLAEVAAVCRRVNFSHKEMDINIMGFDDLLMDIDRIWSEMEPFYTNIPIVTEIPAWPTHPGDGITCSLCLTVITSSRIVYNDNNYHATCANLWLYTVNNNLPVLRYPISNLHSNAS